MSATVLANVTAVAIDGRVLVIAGPPGSGKSSLALALIDRGAVLVGDDAITLTREGDRLLATPPPNTEGVLEVRNVGHVTRPVTQGPVALVLALDPEAPRFPLEQATRILAGVAIPELAFAPGDALQAERAEYALDLRGLPPPQDASKGIGVGTMTTESRTKQHIVLVTGMSGGGKSTALQVLEDLGWEAIDNFPIRLLKRLIGGKFDNSRLAIGVDSRTRGFVPAAVIELFKNFTDRDDIDLTTMFVDCGSAELERRYNETRRPHPLARGRPALDGIRAERELLEPLRRWADIVIDTTDYATNQLQQVVREHFAADDQETALTVTVSSFGFARGMPPLADLLFDMRFLDNPHWVAGLREQTGLDAPVAEHVAADPAFEPAFARIMDLLLDLLPRYAAQDRSYLNIAFGCTGGRHRSVYTAERAAEALRAAGFSPTVIHRNLASRPADPLERS